MEISKRIKEARDLQNISLSELSKRTKIAKSTLQRYETGTTKKIPMSAIAALEQALNLDAGYLMGWSNEPKDGLSEQAPTDKNIIKLAGRDGTYIERELTDEQIELMKSMVKQLPDADDL